MDSRIEASKLQKIFKNLQGGFEMVAAVNLYLHQEVLCGGVLPLETRLEVETE